MFNNVIINEEMLGIEPSVYVNRKFGQPLIEN